MLRVTREYAERQAKVTLLAYCNKISEPEKVKIATVQNVHENYSYLELVWYSQKASGIFWAR